MTEYKLKEDVIHSRNSHVEAEVGQIMELVDTVAKRLKVESKDVLYSLYGGWRGHD
jgi:hypothetical protein